MKHLGDIQKLSGFEVPPVDCVTGGSPCQDLSVAGKRAGLAGERSGLFMEQIRIVKEMREHDRNSGRSGWSIRPRYMVWENVPGALSSNNGEDFRAVLEETARIVEKDAIIPEPPKEGWHYAGAIMGDGWSIAYRVHDAQFWGVPQRRKRISLVADFGGHSAAEILFERKGLSGDSEQSEQEGKGTATSVESSSGEASGSLKFRGEPGSYTLKIRGGCEVDSHGNKAGKGPLVQTELSCTLGVSQDQTLFAIEGNGTRDSHKGDGYKETEISYTLNSTEQHAVCYKKQAHPQTSDEAQGYEETEVNDTLNTFRTSKLLAYGISAYDSNAMKSPNPHSGIYEADTSRTLDLNGGSPACNQGGVAIVQAAGFDPNQGSKAYTVGYEEEKAGTLEAGKIKGVLCLNDQGGGVMSESYDQVGTLRAQEHGHQPLVFENHSLDGRFNELGDTCETLRSVLGTGGNNQPLVLGVDTYNQTTTGDVSMTMTAKRSDADHVPVVCMDVFHAEVQKEKTPALKARDYKDPHIVTDAKTIRGEDVTPTLVSRIGTPVGNTQDDMNVVTYQNVSGSLMAAGYAKLGTQEAANDMYVTPNSIVRRLTPIECERLQGFPDNWTDIGDYIDTNGKQRQTSDSARYKALGNSIATPFWFWLLRRISANYERPATLGSLFDGIGGFPYCWERCNGKGTAIWASEIEEFPIAVTKKHFPEGEEINV